MSKEMKRYEYPEDFWLWEELDELDAELEASGIEDATAWERWDEMESVLMTLAERYTWRRNYPREQYEADRARMIAEGENPRCIMSYSECMAYDLFQAEQEREQEMWDAYDEAMMELEHESKQEAPSEFDAYGVEEREQEMWDAYDEAMMELEHESKQEAPSEFDAYGVEERDRLLALVEESEEVALSELAAFGFAESPFDTEDFEDWYEWDYSDEYFDAWHEACRDILEVTGEFAMDEVYGLVD